MDRGASTSYDVLERMLLDEGAEPMRLPLSLLEDITNRFSPKQQIGSGGFAVVYKGMVGKGMVAVKKLTTFNLHETKFHEELKCLINAKHKNIVRFLGYCAETQGIVEDYEGKFVVSDQRNWLLCFEYVCNGSLDKHIADPSCGLGWRERYRIMKGICEGLLFLHEKRIVHLDLKPANILLDHQMLPKIADFGLSRCLSEDETREITKNLRGTLGYMDPEYLKSGQIAFTSDMYSLGVIIMEILTGVKGYFKAENVVESWLNQLGATEGSMQLEQVRVFSEIAIECMDLDPMKRPVARNIVDRLDKMTSAYYSDAIDISSSAVEPQISLSKENFNDRMLAVENLQKVDVKKHYESEDVAESLGRLHSEECQQEADHISSWGAQDMKQKVNRRGSSISSSISTMLFKLNKLDIFNRKVHRNSNTMSAIERSHIIKIFKKGDLEPIIKIGNLIGQGSFGKVYKGLLDNDFVVVKKPINGSILESEQFHNEVIILSQVVHKNIVRLIGCCLEIDNPMLVYEYLTKGSLNDILHNTSKVPLDLDVRLAIVTGSAHGLAYLHSQARTIILHGDVKPANILLDDNFMPKIADFGISKLIVRNNEHTSHIIGSLSYIDPVYLHTGLLTEKSDVYSFGIVILEIISRKKATSSDNNSLVKSFLEVHKGKKATDLFDRELAVTGNLEILDSLAEVAVECLILDVDQRPTMTDIVERLLILNRTRRLQAV